MSEPVRISVVIPTHNRREKLELTLDHLAKQTVIGGWDVVVVANNCTDATVPGVKDRADRFPVPLRVIEERKPGATAARNAGARQAAGEDILFLDDDILVEPDCMERLAEDRARHPGAWVLGQGFALPEHRATPFGAFREASLPSVPIEQPLAQVAWFASGIALIPRMAFLALGGYAEDFTVAALEDADIAIRAVGAGEVLIFDPGLTFRHNDWAGTSIRDFCQRERIYCATAPLLEERFGAIEHPWSALLAANRPPDWSRDHLRGTLRKRLKGLAGAPRSQAVLLALAERLEARHVPNAVLWPVYRAAIAGAMYAGYQEGLRRRSPSSTAAGYRARR